MATKSHETLKPLRGFDFGLVVKRLEGLYFNVDRDLQRRIEAAVQVRNETADRCLSLLQVMFRFSWNSYCAVSYLAADIPEDPKRKPSYIVVVPNINRQLLDLLFTIAYMLDDFESRSLQYQRAAWRETLDEYSLHKTHCSSDKEWDPHFRNVKDALAKIAERYAITAEQQKDPSSVPYWPTPTQLKDKKTSCREYLRYLAKWLYRDTSVQAHLSFAGLFRVTSFLLDDLVVNDSMREMRERAIQMYRFEQVSRTAMLFLAIATEMDSYSKLGNREAIDYLWGIFAAHADEAKEMYELRYRNRPN